MAQTRLRRDQAPVPEAEGAHQESPPAEPVPHFTFDLRGAEMTPELFVQFAGLTRPKPSARELRRQRREGLRQYAEWKRRQVRALEAGGPVHGDGKGEVAEDGVGRQGLKAWWRRLIGRPA